jgi:hypothetical protein
MARRATGGGPSDTLQRVLAELEVLRLGQESLQTTLMRLHESWVGLFRTLGTQIELLATRVDLLAERVGDHRELAARVAAMEQRVAVLERREPL